MKSNILTLGIIVLIMSFGYAGDVSRIGTTSGSQLLIPVGAKSIALGSSVVSSVTGAEAMYYNPGGVARSSKSEFLFSNMTYIADIDVSYIAGVFNGQDIGSFGFSVKSIDFGDIEETTEDYPDGTGNTYSPTYIVAGLTYSRVLIERISAGVTMKYIHEGIMQTSSNTMALDLGV